MTTFTKKVRAFKKRVIMYLYRRLYKSPFTFFDYEEEAASYKFLNANFKYSFCWWVDWIIRILMLALVFAIGFFIVGCARVDTVTEYKPINIPIKCGVEMPSKPSTTGDVIKDNLLIMQYSDQLRATLNKCK